MNTYKVVVNTTGYLPMQMLIRASSPEEAVAKMSKIRRIPVDAVITATLISGEQ